MRVAAIETLSFHAHARPQDPADRALASLNQGIHAYAHGDLSGAQRHFHRAVALNLRDSEPWYWLGRIQDDLGQPQRAAQCYFLCRNSRQWGPAQEALCRLGHFGQR